MTNFNITPDRRKNINRTKWTYYEKDQLPMWVADMDFPSPKPILDSLQKMIDHGVFGYEMPGNTLKETVASRMDKLYSWKVKPEEVVAVTGIVSGFTLAAQIACTPKKGVAIQTPVYGEFHEVKNNVGTPQVDIPLVQKVSGNILSYEIDWDLFEKQIKKADMFLLCNPHNPLGIIFSRKELARMAEICIKNNVLVVSDEIHSEVLLDGNTFTPMAKLSKEISKNTITLIAPSKTFNVPGLFCGFAIIQDEVLRKRYENQVELMRINVSSAGLQAANAAFSGKCDSWLNELRRYLTGNRDFLVDYVTKYMPDVRLTIPDATYLGWLDFSQTKIEGSPFEFFREKAKVSFSDGKVFGKGYERYIRLNFGTSRKILKEGLDKARKAMNTLR
jgi:cystathionine beta-lyase